MSRVEEKKKARELLAKEREKDKTPEEKLARRLEVSPFAGLEMKADFSCRFKPKVAPPAPELSEKEFLSSSDCVSVTSLKDSAKE